MAAHDRFKTDSLGRAHLRVLVGCLVLGLLAACVTTRPASRGTPPAVTVAVLPLTLPGHEPDTNWFTDGISRELIRALGRDAALRVMAWHASSRYRDNLESPTLFGKSIRATDVLRGTLLQDNQQLLLYVKLVDTRTGHSVWSNSFAGSLKDARVLEQRVARGVASALHVAPAPGYIAKTVDPKAHDLVLGARAILWSASSGGQLDEARRLLDKAIKVDPKSAEAHAVLAQSWIADVPTVPGTLRAATAIPKARAEAREALALDPDNVDALYAMGNVDFNNHDPQQARTEYAHALQIDPSNVHAYIGLGDLATNLQSIRRDFVAATRLDPFNAIAQNNLADTDLDLGHYRQALLAVVANQQLQPQSVDAAFLLALDDALLHQNKAAVQAFDISPPRSDFERQLASAGKLAYRSMLEPKLRSQAVTAVAALNQWSSLDPTSQEDLLQVELVLGEKNRVLAQLPQLCAQSQISCSDLGSFPLWLPLHGIPQFGALVKHYDTMSQTR